MAFNGEEGAIISLEEGAHMTAAFREHHSDQNLCVFFGKEMLTTLLSQSGAEGLRFYFALGHDSKLTLVTVAANGEGADMLDKVGNKGAICPSECCTESPLCNSSVAV